MSRAAAPFRPGVVIAMLVAGVAAFLLLLYAIGAGWTGRQDNNGGAHALAKGLNGYAGLVQLLRLTGHDVSLSRTASTYSTRSLLVLTPTQNTSADKIAAIIRQRTFKGPTLLILPKWNAIEVPATMRAKTKAKQGWTVLGGISSPGWFGKVRALSGMQLVTGTTQDWSAFGLRGKLPDPRHVQGFLRKTDTDLYPIVTDSQDDILAGYLKRGGYHPDLAADAGITFTRSQEDRQDPNMKPLVIVGEPDLLDNYGLSDKTRSRAAVDLVDASMDGANLPVVFDLTLPGLGTSNNLLSLVFRPPFLAATLALLLMALVIAWRGLARFGPARAETPELAHGKTQLARNGAALVERARRWHLLGAPYAALAGSRIATALGVSERSDTAREDAIDRVLAAHHPDLPSFSSLAEALREARKPADLLRAASAMRTLERTVSR